MRVVSLLPSATEIVCALGRRPDLVGRSEECDYPSDVQSLPVVMRSRSLAANLSSADIDRIVRKTRGSGESLYELDLPRLRGLVPDLLLTQDLCGVCSVTDREVEEACTMAGVTPKILSVAPRTLEEVWGSIEQIGAALGEHPTARRVVAELRERATAVPAEGRPRVAVVEWLDPPFLAGLWTPDIVRVAGGESIGPAAGEPGRRTTWSAIAAESADLVVVSPCSFSVERTLGEIEAGRLHQQIEQVRPHAKVVLADEAFFSRPGPRLADGVDLVRSCLRGEARSFPMPVVSYTPPARTVVS